jgi:Tfp pilus assembly protein PilW
MAFLPPPPTQDAAGSYAWLDWYRQLRNYISQSGSVPWNVIDFSGSDIVNIISRSHQNLQSLQGGTTGQYYHLTQSKHTELSGTFLSVVAASATVNGESNVVCNYAGTVTLTLPAASSNSGRSIRIKTITANTVISASSNVKPINSNTTGTAILAATAGKFAILVSDGTDWIIMEAN